MPNSPLQLLNQWMLAYTEGVEFNPFKEDPDGGEMRIAAALREVLMLLDDADRLQQPRVNAIGGQVELPVKLIRTAIAKHIHGS